MSSNMNTMTVSEKKKLIREKCKNKEKKDFLCKQVNICEDLCLPLTEEKIILLVSLPFNQMMRELSKHKKMY